MSIYIKFRETPNGTEYWNKELKRTELFAPGTSPDEVQTEGMVGQYSASGKIAELHEGEQIIPSVNPLDEMDADQLRAYAIENDIEVPGTMKKADTIRQYIIEELNVAADAE